jgi:hypothetical protein
MAKAHAYVRRNMCSIEDRKTKRQNKEGTYKADDFPYYSVDRQLGQAKKTLARQQEEAAYKLKGVHCYYKGLLNKPPETEPPSAPDG